MKIAPRLQHLHLIKGRLADKDLAYDDEGQRAELRALLAVARAASRVGQTDDAVAESAALGRALTRLEKVSGRKP